MAEDGEVSTLHVANLPQDFKERELFLLFSTQQGFKGGQLKYTPGKTMGFVVFETRDQAERARSCTDGLQWTGNPPEFTLRVQFAQKQMRSAKGDRMVVSNSNQLAAQQAAQGQVAGGKGVPQYGNYQPFPQQQQQYQAGGARGHTGFPQQQQQASTTIFVGQIPDHIRDEDLLTFFGALHPIKMHRQGNKAWLAFHTVDAANQALRYNGQPPHNLKVSFAKSEMRARDEQQQTA